MIEDIFSEYDTDIICVSDFEITYQGTAIDYIRNVDGIVEFWAGNPDTDEHAEQIFPTEDAIDEILGEIEFAL